MGFLSYVFGDDIPLGSELKTSRMAGIYTHHGIYIGRGKVIHYAGLADGLKSDKVKKVTLEQFHAGKGYEIVKYPQKRIKYSPKQVVARAKSRLGENKYCIGTNNCQHFSYWCITGDSKSRQVDDAMAMLRYPTLYAVRKVAYRMKDWLDD